MWWRRFRYLLLLIALCSVATCPAAKRACTAKRRANEADQLLEYIADRVEASIKATGHVPGTAAGPTPLPTCCEVGGTCEPDPATWATPGWQALQFSIDGDYRYTYSYEPDASGRTAVVPQRQSNNRCAIVVPNDRAVQLHPRQLALNDQYDTFHC